LSHIAGELSVLFCSVVNTGRVESIVYGEKGMIRMNKWWHTPTSLDIIPDNGKPEHLSFNEEGFGYQYEAAEVMKCLDEGKTESVQWSWEDSRKLISLLDMIRQITGIHYPAEVESL
jgi:predicted dehydrogenase